MQNLPQCLWLRHTAQLPCELLFFVTVIVKMSNTPRGRFILSFRLPIEIQFEKQSNKQYHVHSFATMGCICGFTDLPVSLGNKKIHVTAKATRCYGPHFTSWETQQTLCVVTKAQFIIKTCFLWMCLTGYPIKSFFFFFPFFKCLPESRIC